MSAYRCSTRPQPWRGLVEALDWDRPAADKSARATRCSSALARRAGEVEDGIRHFLEPGVKCQVDGGRSM